MFLPNVIKIDTYNFERAIVSKSVRF